MRDPPPPRAEGVPDCLVVTACWRATPSLAATAPWRPASPRCPDDSALVGSRASTMTEAGRDRADRQIDGGRNRPFGRIGSPSPS